MKTVQLKDTNGKDITVQVHYVPKEELSPAYGYAYFFKGYVLVREDLSPLVKSFVEAHELYHMRDRHKWWGVFGSELRANLVPGLKDPIGLIACIYSTITDPSRIKFYIDRLMKGF